MNRPLVLLCIFLTVLLPMVGAGCGGGQRQEAPRPEAHTDGEKALRKGNQWFQKGCYSEALRHYHDAYARMVAADHLPAMALCLNNIGNVYLHTDRAQDALAFYVEAEGMYRLQNDRAGQIRALGNQAAALLALERESDADDAVARAEALAADARASSPQVMTLRATLLTRQNEFGTAETLLSDALAAAGAQDDRTRSTIYHAMGRLALARGDLEAAITSFESALAADRSQSYYRGMAEDLRAMADIRRRQDRPADAVPLYKRSLTLFALIGASSEAAAVREALMETADSTGQAVDITLHFTDTWLANPGLDSPCR